jgi:hypothetical protein
MTPILESSVSVFTSRYDKHVREHVPLDEMLTRIQSGIYQDPIARLRQYLGVNQAAYKAKKDLLPSFTPCCALHTRDGAVPLVDRLRSVVGLVHYDCDHVADPAALKERLAADPATVFAFTSPSGTGVKVGIAATGITDAVSYKAVWHGVLRHLHQTYTDVEISEDEHVKYVHALCYVSHDPDLYRNPGAIPVVVPLHGPDDEEPPLEIPDSPDAGRIPFATLAQAVWFIPCEDYDPWCEVGMALHASGYPQARTLWDAWSQQSTKYSATIQTKKSASFKKDGGIHAGVILTLAHQHGWRPAGEPHPAAGITSHLLNGKITPVDPHEIKANPITSLSSLTSQPVRVNRWPVLLPEARYGLVGDYVGAIEKHSEADPVALLVQFLTEFGIVAGRHCYGQVGDTRHYGNLFAVIVGRTARSRKGTSYGHIAAQMHTADPTWGRTNLIKGAGSGEGLVYAVRDTRMGREPIKDKGRIVGYQDVELDPGVEDKRALYMTGEFSSVLKVASREGNTLSETLRDIWDTGYLRCTTKNNPLTATDAHIGIIGHITIDEIRKLMTSIDMANGFANRFLWICAQRSKVLPDGGNLSSVNFQPLVTRLRKAIAFSQESRIVVRKTVIREAWHAVYSMLSENRTGLADTILARAEAIVFRTSILYALLDCSAEITLDHLNAALALWQYAEDSAAYIFGDTTGDETADPIIRALRRAGESGLTREQLQVDVFQRHIKATELTRALTFLEEQGRVSCMQKPTGSRGRPATIYHLITTPTCEESEVNTSRYLIASNKATKHPDLVCEVNAKEMRRNSTEEAGAAHDDEEPDDL